MEDQSYYDMTLTEIINEMQKKKITTVKLPRVKMKDDNTITAANLKDSVQWGQTEIIIT